MAKVDEDFFCSADSAHDHPAVSFPETEALMLHEKGTRLIDFLPGSGVSVMARIQEHFTHYY